MNKENSVILGPNGLRVGEKIAVLSNGVNIKVGRDLVNEGAMKLNKTNLEVGQDFLIGKKAKLITEDPERIKQIVLDIATTGKNLSEIGKMFSERLFSVNRL